MHLSAGHSSTSMKVMQSKSGSNGAAQALSITSHLSNGQLFFEMKLHALGAVNESTHVYYMVVVTLFFT